MKTTIMAAALLLLAACGDDTRTPSNAAQPDAGATSNNDVGTDAANDQDADLDCADNEITYEGGCSSEGLSFNVPILDENVGPVTSRSYPSVSGGVRGFVSRTNVTDQCYVETVTGGNPGEPTELPCFDAGTLTLSSGGTSVEMPWNADSCYEDGVGEPWAGETVTFDFAGGVDIEAVSFEVDFPEEVVVEVVEEDGAATITRMGATEPDAWRLWWTSSNADDIYCDPVDDVVTLSAQEIAAIDARGTYGTPVAIEVGLGGSYVSGEKGVIVNMGAFTNVRSSLW